MPHQALSTYERYLDWLGTPGPSAPPSVVDDLLGRTLEDRAYYDAPMKNGPDGAVDA